MNTYIALLRGINVSGQKKVRMIDLKSHLEELGFQNIQTYIQSGNIIFQQKETGLPLLEARIKQKILEKYGFDVPVIIKTPPELVHVLEHNPFLNDPAKDPKRMYVTFLSDIPSSTLVTALKAINHSPEEYVLDRKNIYGFSPSGFGRAKMSNNFFENKLKVTATTRNWATVNKLAEMAGATNE